jgi:CRISPR-associated protein Cas6
MFWQEDIKEENFIIPDTVLDIAFNIKSDILPIDNIFLLKTSLSKTLPWLSEINAGIFDISVADGNGWTQDTTGFFYPSKRSKLTLRLPKEYIEKALILVGKTLDLGEYQVQIIKANKPKKLSDSPILFAKNISSENESEDEFLQKCFNNLAKLNIAPKKMLAGLGRQIKTDVGVINTRSLMVADLRKPESIYLQEQGLGDDKLLGLGIFVPQKGIDSVDAV